MTKTLTATAPKLVGALITLGFPTLAQAQLEEIVVTAQKREQGINDVGITVNAFTGEQLANYGVKSAEDLEILTPGLTISNSALGAFRPTQYAELGTTTSRQRRQVPLGSTWTKSQSLCDDEPERTL